MVVTSGGLTTFSGPVAAVSSPKAARSRASMY